MSFSDQHCQMLAPVVKGEAVGFALEGPLKRTGPCLKTRSSKTLHHDRAVDVREHVLFERALVHHRYNRFVFHTHN